MVGDESFMVCCAKAGTAQAARAPPTTAARMVRFMTLLPGYESKLRCGIITRRPGARSKAAGDRALHAHAPARVSKVKSARPARCRLRRRQEFFGPPGSGDERRIGVE